MDNYRGEGNNLFLPVGEGVSAGDPVMLGNHMPGVASIDAESASPYRASVKLKGRFDLSVKGHNGVGNTAISQFDPIYYNAAATPKLNANSSGIFYGIALEDVASGATATIEVLLRPCCVVPDEES